MPSTLKQITTGPEPASARKIRQYLERHVKAEAPYFSTEEVLTAVRASPSNARRYAQLYLKGWYKQVGRNLWWSTPEHIKKL